MLKSPTLNLDISDSTLFQQALYQGLIPSDYEYRLDFSRQEIQDIIQYRPLVSFNTYVAFRNLTDEQLRKSEPLIEKLIPNTTPYDIFFYKTRNYLLYHPKLDLWIRRYNKYKFLPSSIQHLFTLLYPTNQLDFVHATINPLEKVLLAFAENFQTTPLLKVIGNRYGFSLQGIPTDQSPIILYNKLKQFIQRQSPSLYSDIDLETLINMSKSDYQQYISNKPSLPPYEDRLYGKLDL